MGAACGGPKGLSHDQWQSVHFLPQCTDTVPNLRSPSYMQALKGKMVSSDPSKQGRSE